jgi:putative membrane protein
MKQNIFTAVVAGVLMTTSAMAQTPPPLATAGAQDKASSAAATLAAGDKAFVKEAAIGGMAEVDLGTLAKEKASSPDVKQFGDRMVTDHSKANDELKQWAQQKNVTLPAELDAKHKATHERLAKLSGAAFDKAYMADMVEDHVKDVAAFKKASTAAKDPDLKAFVTKTLPTLEDHLKQARDVQAKLGAMIQTATEKTPKP